MAGNNFNYPLHVISGKPGLDMPADGIRVCASDAMTDYDRMSRPVPKDQQVPLPFHLTNGYREAVARLEAQAPNPRLKYDTSDTSQLSQKVEKPVRRPKR
jgi:hypothetical protein